MTLVENMQARHHDALEREGQGWMAAAGAAVGFGLHEASGVAWGPSLLLTGAAVSVWCLSFAAGIFRIAAHRNSLQQNVMLLLLRSEGVPAQNTKVFQDRHAERANKQVRWRGAQLWSLAIGAGLYLGASVSTAIERRAVANDKRCLAIQRDMLSARPLRTDDASLFQVLGCRPQGEGSVYVSRADVRKRDAHYNHVRP